MTAFTTGRKARYTAEQMRSTGIKPNLSLVPLRSGVTTLFGSGANIAVFSGSDGQVMVDSGFAVSQPEIQQALSQISREPVRQLINTHWHFDHTDGNEWIHAAGATIIAQERTRTRLEQSQAIPEFEATFPPSPKSALPSILFNQHLELRSGDETIELRHYAPAHTDSDISVYFRQADILHTGDTWFNGIYPFTDYESGGSIDGMIAASSANLELAGNETLVVCGHGAIGNRQNLLEYHYMLLGVRFHVATMKSKGATLGEVLESGPTAPYDHARAAGFVPPDLFVSLIYRGV